MKKFSKQRSYQIRSENKSRNLGNRWLSVEGTQHFKKGLWCKKGWVSGEFQTRMVYMRQARNHPRGMMMEEVSKWNIKW